MNRRILLHNMLCNVLGCPTTGKDCRVYFQPPTSAEMKYPAIVYSRNRINNTYADDGVFLSNRQYTIIVIDKNPDSNIVTEVSKIKSIQHNTSYTCDNLNHDVFNLAF